MFLASVENKSNEIFIFVKYLFSALVERSSHILPIPKEWEI